MSLTSVLRSTALVAALSSPAFAETRIPSASLEEDLLRDVKPEALREIFSDYRFLTCLGIGVTLVLSGIAYTVYSIGKSEQKECSYRSKNR